MASMFPVGTLPGATINTLGNSTWSSANPGGTMGTDPYGSGSNLTPMATTYGVSNDAKSSQLTQYMQNIANEQARQFDQEHSLKKRQIDQDHEVALMNARTEQDKLRADQEYRNAQVQLQREQLAFDRDKFGQEFQQKAEQFALELGLSRDQFEEGARQFNATQAQQQGQFEVTSGQEQQRINNQAGQFGVTSEQEQQRINNQNAQFGQDLDFRRAGLGYQVAQTQAQLAQNPADYWQAAELARGVASNPQTATFLTSLRNNTRLPMTGAQAGVGPANSLDNIYAQLGYPAGGASGATVNAQQDAQWRNAASADATTQAQPWFQQQNANNPYLQGAAAGSASGHGADAGVGAVADRNGQTVYTGGSSSFNEAGAGGYGIDNMHGGQGQGMPVGAQGPQNSMPTTLSGVQTGGGYPNAVRDANNLGAIRNIALAGAHKLGAGQLERLTPTEFQLFQSGLGRAGADRNTFLTQYRASRIGNTPGMARAA